MTHLLFSQNQVHCSVMDVVSRATLYFLSFVPHPGTTSVPFLSVTATATEEIRTTIMETLHMEECDAIYIETNRSNICDSVKEIAALDRSNFEPLCRC